MRYHLEAFQGISLRSGVYHCSPGCNVSPLSKWRLWCLRTLLLDASSFIQLRVRVSASLKNQRRGVQSKYTVSCEGVFTHRGCQRLRERIKQLLVGDRGKFSNLHSRLAGSNWIHLISLNKWNYCKIGRTMKERVTFHFSVLCLLNLSNYFKYGSSFLTNTGMNYVPYQFGNIYLCTKCQYTSTNYYLYYICTSTGSKII